MRFLFIFLIIFSLANLIDVNFNSSKALTCRDFPDHPSCSGYQRKSREYGSFPNQNNNREQEEYNRNRINECYERNPIPLGMGCR